MISFGPEVISEPTGAFVGQDAADDLDPVVPAVIGQNVEMRTDGAELGVGRAEAERSDARQENRAGAHGARLERDEKVAAFETPVVEALSGLAQGENLGVGGRVAQGHAAVVAATDGGFARDDDGADRDFVFGGGELGLRERLAHPRFGSARVAHFFANAFPFTWAMRDLGM